ncbi:hypothetical protein KIL84_009637 [Mauremys mutica]|uniref:Uncharacterized protein n=1 Tax=Mauremys mutica TaxID=74926 RepID=A0A9D3XMD7_9SAUR|nr:hypothetical protein KIL84_009637 [Mauremys mutica]
MEFSKEVFLLNSSSLTQGTELQKYQQVITLVHALPTRGNFSTWQYTPLHLSTAKSRTGDSWCCFDVITCRSELQLLFCAGRYALQAVENGTSALCLTTRQGSHYQYLYVLVNGLPEGRERRTHGCSRKAQDVTAWQLTKC